MLRLMRSIIWGVLVTGAMGLAAGEAVAASASGTGAKDLVLKGDAKCTGCHDESDEPQKSMLDLHPSVLSIGRTSHGVRGDARTPTCTDCHGASEKHLNFKRSKDDPKAKPPKPDRQFTKNTPTPAEERSAACLSCHKGEKRSYWNGSQHANGDVACTDCHQVHAQRDKVREKKLQAEICFTCHKEQRADIRKISTHPVDAGKVACSDCHNPHGSNGPKMLKKATLTETCYTCHAEKRGPYLFEHQPVTEDCANCHTPHGSNIGPLLKSRAPFLCQECHDGTHASGTAVGPNAAGYQAGLSRTTPSGAAQYPSGNVTGRACMNCHVLVHGSNNPAGGYFQR